jgi:hypothetical protein
LRFGNFRADFFGFALDLAFGRAAGRDLDRLAMCASFRAPTPPRTLAPLAMVRIHVVRSSDSSG